MSGAGPSEPRRGDPPPARAADLTSALCHELGNWLAAMRLQAHLLDETLGPRELAEASLEIDELCERASTLLAQLPPLVAAAPASPGPTDPAGLVHDVSRVLADQGLRGVTLDVEVEEGLAQLCADRATLLPVLQNLATGALEAVRPEGSVGIRARGRGAEVALVVEDAAPFEGEAGDWRRLPLRGRILGWALADALARKVGGRLEVNELDPGTRIELVIPSVDAPEAGRPQRPGG
ncbi:MAG: sensor histidine kinase [Myxococcota bacterium]